MASPSVYLAMSWSLIGTYQLIIDKHLSTDPKKSTYQLIIDQPPSADLWSAPISWSLISTYHLIIDQHLSADHWLAPISWSLISTFQLIKCLPQKVYPAVWQVFWTCSAQTHQNYSWPVQNFFTLQQQKNKNGNVKMTQSLSPESHQSHLESLELPSTLQVCFILSTQCLIGNYFCKTVLIPVGQAPSLDETWSFRKLCG